MQRARFDFDVITGPAFPRPAVRDPVQRPGPMSDDLTGTPRQDQAAERDTPLSASPASATHQ